MNNFKIAVIPGEGIHDGEIITRGVMEEGTLHSKYLLDYAKEAYPDHSIFGRLTIAHQPEAISFFLEELGNIVFLHTTHNDKQSSCSGTLFLPKVVTEKQKDTLYTFIEGMHLKSLSIAYDLYLEDGMVEGKEMYMGAYPDGIKLLDQYFEEEKNDAKGK